MFSKKTVCFITGASRGLGESIAVNFASKFPTGSLMVLLARSESGLETVKKRLLEKAPHVTALVHRFDQGSLNQQVFEAVFSQSLKSSGSRVEDFQQAVLVNNAGSVKPMKFTRNLPDVQQLSEYMNINVAGVIALTSEFLRVFPASSGASRVIINASSLAAVQVFKSWPMYCTGKAARDMFFKVVAAEEPDIRVLNYAPGPLETDMANELIQSEDEDIRKWASNAQAEKSFLSCDTSVAKLTQALEKNTFESGAHFDFYDEL